MLSIALFFTIFTAHIAQADPADAELLRPVVNANKALNARVARPDMSCACSMSGSTNEVTFENEAQCGPDRNYLKGSIESFRKIDSKGYFTKARTYLAGLNTIPQKCVLYIMRTTFRDFARTPEEKKQEDIQKGVSAEEIAAKNYTPDTSQFAGCAKSNGEPVRIRHKACVTEDYFNLIYNSFADVADCMDLPMNFALPKFANESGLNVNAFGPVNDGGVGQFTDSALRDVAVNYPEFQAQINRSKKASCQRLRSIPGAMVAKASDIKTADAERCHAISMPPNPVRSMIYYGIFYHSAKRYAGNAWRAGDEKSPGEETVEQLLAKAGAPLDKEKLKEMMFVMAYNAGPRPPVTAFKEWLRYRQAQKAKISAIDFNFDFWPPKGFSAIEKQAEADVKALAPSKGWDAARTQREVQLERVKRRTAHVNGNGRPLTLPEYLFVYRNSIYISAVKVQATRLNKVFGEGTCTQKKFLSL